MSKNFIPRLTPQKTTPPKIPAPRLREDEVMGCEYGSYP
jgi:hypothetical protein